MKNIIGVRPVNPVGKAIDIGFPIELHFKPCGF